MVRNVVSPAMNSVRISVPCSLSPKYLSSIAAPGISLFAAAFVTDCFARLAMRPLPPAASGGKPSPGAGFPQGPLLWMLWIARGFFPLRFGAGRERNGLAKTGWLGLKPRPGGVRTEGAMDFDPVLLARLQFAF